MLAMNVSKEVITGFGLMNEKFETSNETSKLANEQLLSALDAKAGEAKGILVAAGIAHNVKTITDNFFNYIASLKSQAAAGFEIDPETGNLPKIWIKEIILTTGLQVKGIQQRKRSCCNKQV
jgi:hypothetical protein